MADYTLTRHQVKRLAQAGPFRDGAETAREQHGWVMDGELPILNRIPLDICPGLFRMVNIILTVAGRWRAVGGAPTCDLIV